MRNDEIVRLCKAEAPDIIYLSIGCAQGHYLPGDPHSTPQEHPPCIAALGGKQICILVDPYLESPIRAAPEKADGPIIRVGKVSFIPVRRAFVWTGVDDRYFIRQLCSLAIEGRGRLIVQDYSGQYIQNFYPLVAFGRRLLSKVLFDMTYNDSGCFVDFSKVKILMREDGTFIQPLYDRIAHTVPFIEAEYIATPLKQRHESMWCYVKRLHRIQTGAEEVRDWCTPDVVYQHMAKLCPVYGTPLGTNIDALEQLMIAYLFDLCEAVGDVMTNEAAEAIVKAPGKEYQELIGALKDVLIVRGTQQKTVHPE